MELAPGKLELESIAGPVTPEAVAGLTGHPRVWLDAAGWEGLRRRVARDGMAGAMLARMRVVEDQAIALGEIDYTGGGGAGNIIRPMRAAERRIRSAAMLFRLTGEERYLRSALGRMRRLAGFDWPGSHFMDAAIGSVALGTGYDWLYEWLTEEDREKMAGRVVRDGLMASVRDEEKSGWVWADHNWNQVCHGGLVVGAMATAERDPGLARRVMNRAIAMLPRAAKCYAPDGVYPEGPGYWAYGTTFHVLQVEAYRRAFGTDFGLTGFEGLMASAGVLDRLTGPGGEFFNYFDNYAKRQPMAVLLWFARELGDCLMMRREVERLLAVEVPKYGSLLEMTEDTALSLLWYETPQDEGPGAVAGGGGCEAWVGEGFNPVVVLSCGGGWLAAKAGGCDKSHGHMDAGAFVYEAGGVRWAIELDYEPYATVMSRSGMSHGELFDYSQGSERWDVMRLGPEGHSILRFDGRRQVVSGRATVVESSSAAAGEQGDRTRPWATMDLTPVYGDCTEEVQRRFEVGADGTLKISGTWRGRGDGMGGEMVGRVQWQWMTLADVDLVEGGAVLRQGGREMRLRVECEAGWVMRVEDLSRGIHRRFDGGYPRLRRVTVEVRGEERGGGRGQLVVTATVGG